MTPTQLWSVTISGQVPYVPSLAASQGILYYNSYYNSNPQLIAVSASDGKTVHWKQSINPDSYGRAVPVVDDNLVFDPTQPSGGVEAFAAFDAQTGVQRWSYTSPDFPAGFQEPSVANGVVYVATNSDSKLFALNEQTGSLKWSVVLGNPPPQNSFAQPSTNESPLVANGVVYAGGNDGKWYAFDAASGETLWSFATASTDQQNGFWGYSSGVAGNGIVYFYSNYYPNSNSPYNGGTLYAVRISDHSLLWKQTTGHQQFLDVAPVVTGNSVLFEGGDNTNQTLIAFDPLTGKQQWQHGNELLSNNNDFTAHSQILAVNSVIYCGGAFSLFGFAADGTLLWSTAVDTEQLILANGVIYDSAGYADNTTNSFGARITALSPGS